MWNKIKCFFDYHRVELVKPFGGNFVSELHQCVNCKSLFAYHPHFGHLPFTKKHEDLMSNPAYKGESVSVQRQDPLSNDQ